MHTSAPLSDPDRTLQASIEHFATCAQMHFLLAWRSHLSRGNYCPMHSHHHVEIVLAADGQGTTRIADGPKIALAANQVIVYPAQKLHDHTALTAGHHICVHIVSAAPLPVTHESCIYLPQIDPYIRTEMTLLAQLGRPEAQRLTSIGRLSLDLRAAALLLHILHHSRQTQAAEHYTPAQRHADMAQHIVQEQLESIRTLKDISDQIGISEDYLRHAFKTHFGISLHQFLVRARLDRAKDLLRHSSMPLKAIAPACGLRNERYLCQLFRTNERCTPGQFRKQWY